MSRARSSRRTILLAAATLSAFLVGAVVWFPAALALRALPAPYTCLDPTGSLWRGACGDLRMGGASIGAMSWTLRALPLLRVRASADVSWVRSGSRFDGHVEATPSAIEVRDLRGEADLSTLRALPFWPPALLQAWSPGEGRLRFDLKRVALQGQRPTHLEGRVDVDGLVLLGPERWLLGDYRIDWRAGPSPVGRLIDRGGPLALEATIAPAVMSDGAVAPPGGAWRLDGKVRARDPTWRPRLSIFGPADTAGQHALSIEWR